MSSNNRSHTQQQQIIEDLDKRRGKIFSRTGGWIPGKGIFSHGHSMLEELVGIKSYFQILILNATGKLVERSIADWVEAVYGCLSWPDPRIWCNQVGALAATTRTSVVAASLAGTLAADSRTYGILPTIEGVEFIQAALQQHKKGLSAQDIVNNATLKRGGKPHIMGYIRPIAKGDERIETMERVSKSLNITEGEHLSLAYSIEDILLEKFDEGMNINGYISAVLSDLGFTAQETYQMFCTLVTSGITACYLDVYHRPEDTFLPLRCSDISYIGVANRDVP